MAEKPHHPWLEFKTGNIHNKREPRVRVPPEVKAERDLTINYPSSLTGDPVPWRSALWKKDKPT